MENHRHSRVPILKSFVGAISPINAPDSAGRHRFRHPPLSPIIYPYAFDISDSPSPLMNYLCSSGPAVVGAASVLSSPVFVTPLKVEEDVLVMDGIPVPKTDKGSGARVGSNLASLNLNSTTSQQGGSAAENGDSIKAEFCRHWKDSGTCRFGSNCQFAHSTEDLRPPGLSARCKLEICVWFLILVRFLANRASNHTTVAMDQTHHHFAGIALQLTKSLPPPPQQPSHCRYHPHQWPQQHLLSKSTPIMDPSLIAKAQILLF